MLDRRRRGKTEMSQDGGNVRLFALSSGRWFGSVWEAPISCWRRFGLGRSVCSEQVAFITSRAMSSKGAASCPIWVTQPLATTGRRRRRRRRRWRRRRRRRRIRILFRLGFLGLFGRQVKPRRWIPIRNFVDGNFIIERMFERIVRGLWMRRWRLEVFVVARNRSRPSS